MNVNINFNEKSGEIDLKTEDGIDSATSVADAGAPSGDLAQSSDEIDNLDLDTTDDTGSELLDIGGPAEWLIQAMAQSSEGEEDTSNESIDDDFEDGGSGPEA